MVRRYWHRQSKGRGFPDDGTDEASAYVRVDYGRWIVDCPFCPQAQYADPDDRRFMCVGCWNEQVGGRWVPVVWPDDPTGIEALLKPRLHDHTRAWNPHETKADLERQNKTLQVAGVKGRD